MKDKPSEFFKVPQVTWQKLYDEYVKQREKDLESLKQERVRGPGLIRIGDVFTAPSEDQPAMMKKFNDQEVEALKRNSRLGLKPHHWDNRPTGEPVPYQLSVDPEGNPPTREQIEKLRKGQEEANRGMGTNPSGRDTNPELDFPVQHTSIWKV